MNLWALITMYDLAQAEFCMSLLFYYSFFSFDLLVLFCFFCKLILSGQPIKDKYEPPSLTRRCTDLIRDTVSSISSRPKSNPPVSAKTTVRPTPPPPVKSTVRYEPPQAARPSTSNNSAAGIFAYFYLCIYLLLHMLYL